MPGQPHQLFERRLQRQVRQPVFGRLGRPARPLRQQPELRVRLGTSVIPMQRRLAHLHDRLARRNGPMILAAPQQLRGPARAASRLRRQRRLAGPPGGDPGGAGRPWVQSSCVRPAAAGRGSRPSGVAVGPGAPRLWPSPPDKPPSAVPAGLAAERRFDRNNSTTN